MGSMSSNRRETHLNLDLFLSHFTPRPSIIAVVLCIPPTLALSDPYLLSYMIEGYTVGVEFWPWPFYGHLPPEEKGEEGEGVAHTPGMRAVRRRRGASPGEGVADGGEDGSQHHHEGVVPGRWGKELQAELSFRRDRGREETHGVVRHSCIENPTRDEK